MDVHAIEHSCVWSIHVRGWAASVQSLSQSSWCRHLLSTLVGCVKMSKRMSEWVVCKAFGDTSSRNSNMLAASAPLPSRHYIVSCIINSGIGSGWGAGVSLCLFPDSFFSLHLYTHIQNHIFYDPLFSVQREEAIYQMNCHTQTCWEGVW